MSMTLTMTVKARGHLVLDLAYWAQKARRRDWPRLVAVDGRTVFDPSAEPDDTPVSASSDHAS